MSETRPKRHVPSEGRPSESAFEDPLSNYDPVEYADELERVLAEESIGGMEITPFAAIDPDARIGEVVARMERESYYSMIVVEDGKPIGIFSERDVLNKVAQQFDAVKDKPIRELMTPDPVCVYETDTLAKALNLMAVGGFRRIPVLGLDDRVIGVIGPRRTVRFLQDYLA